MIKRELVEPASFKQVRENKSTFDSNATYFEDCDFTPPRYRWSCLLPVLKCRITWNKIILRDVFKSKKRQRAEKNNQS